MERKGKFEVLKISDIIIDAGFNVYAPTDDASLFGLQDSIAETGQLNPVIVNRTDDGDHLVAGQRRLEALTEADAETVECKVFVDMTDLEKAEIHIVENEQRRAPAPMDQARGMKRLRDLSRSTKQIADLYGVSEDTVLRREKLLELPPEVQKMIERPLHALPIHQAGLLAGLSDSDALQLARKIAPKTGPVMGEKDARMLVDDHVNGEKLPGMQSSDKSGGKKEAKCTAKKSAADPDSSKDGCPSGSGSAPPQSPQQKKNAKAVALKAVKGNAGISGKIGIDDSGALIVTGAMVTVKLDTGGKHPQLHTVKLNSLPLDIGADATASVIKLLKKCQPKEVKKTTKKNAKK